MSGWILVLPILAGALLGLASGLLIESRVLESMRRKKSQQGAKLPIDRPCSACSGGDPHMKYHNHHPPFRPDSQSKTFSPLDVLLIEDEVDLQQSHAPAAVHSKWEVN
jgi:hypothetical protein